MMNAKGGLLAGGLLALGLAGWAIVQGDEAAPVAPVKAPYNTEPSTLPFTSPQGVHAADDVILTAVGPGAEQFKGRIDNTRVFRAIVSALGLGRP